HTFKGRIDCLVKYADFIYVFEFKVDDTATNALRQINDKEYSLPYMADTRKLYKVGVSFDSKERILKEYCIE
ncbi:PD-(D/E)XK nuclease domain-containing protein, partial [Pseudobutyrivibrio sp.]